jgi:hypothetical protein
MRRWTGALAGRGAERQRAAGRPAANLPDNILHVLLAGASLLIAVTAGALGASTRRASDV